MGTVKELLDIARRELGTKESPAGSNHVRYNTWYYGREVSGPDYPWCVTFVQWVFARAGVALPIRTASCGALMRSTPVAGCWVYGDYRPGDVAIYDWGGDKVPDHCGIVEAVSGSKITAIEGNTAVGNDSDGGEVMVRTRPLRTILGAVRPLYEEERTLDNTPGVAHKAGVEWAVKNGIMTGNAAGDLMLTQPVTRQQMCTMLYRLAKLEGKA